MFTLLIALGSAFAFILAYHTYGKWLGSRLYKLSRDAICPAYRLADGMDYIPSSKSIVFGHHFTSIAGTGPIIGPAIAVTWGWLPALLWVLFGSIFIGAVHDFGALILSMRNDGRSIGEITGTLLGKRAKLLFSSLICLALWVILAIFGLVIAKVFKSFPSAIFPCAIQAPIAMLIGFWMYKKKGTIFIPSSCALLLMYGSVFIGDYGFVGTFNQWAANLSNMTWIAILLGYAAIASLLPVWLLLQPRDYINSLQLISALLLLVVGLCIAAFFGGAPLENGERPALELVAPAWRFDTANAPAIFPFLFVTIACGACSGFHSLVAGGTSSKQLKHETDAQMVGYGSMLLEAFLAVLVILACCVGLGLSKEEWLTKHSDWNNPEALASFICGAGNFLKALGLSPNTAIALIAVLVASFASTTLDTTCRLQRYILQEFADHFLPKQPLDACKVCGFDLNIAVSQPQHKPDLLHAGHCPSCNNPFDIRNNHLVNIGDEATWHTRLRKNPISWLGNPYIATLFACVTALLLATSPKPNNSWEWQNLGQGALLLWPLFAATNQLIAGIGLLLLCAWLHKQNRNITPTLFPAIFMLVVPAIALGWQSFDWFIGDNQRPVLAIFCIANLLLEAWLIVEAILCWHRTKTLPHH